MRVWISLLIIVLLPSICSAESLSAKRISFSTNISKLVLYLNDQGVDVAYDQVKRCRACTVGHPKSTHKVGLAADLLFYINGVWLSDDDPRTSVYYNLAHNHWDILGGARRIKKDLNHFSYEYGGMR